MDNDYIYCTAIIKSTNEVNYNELIKIFRGLEKDTNNEDGCVFFKVIPMSENKETIALWEIWKDEESFYKHHQLDHTKNIANQKLTLVEVFESSVELDI
ncbi:putative quinol monooxygenase [Mammaliicoccus sciuri]|uniref:putative quinol monooxygenase n=1 Tax=Mammaliicoccus sciuri TaxID=1296 RepID=UPI003F562AD5